MASTSPPFTFFSLLTIFSFTLFHTTMAADPDIITDFIVSPDKGEVVDGSYFTFTGMRSFIGAEPPSTFKVSKVSIAEFPALNGQSVSYAVLQYPAGTANPPHIHPRSAELLLVLDGALQVGFLDTTNKLFTQSLQAGDIFVFPKGLAHFQFNADMQNSALAISGFGSVNAGTVSLPSTLFGTGVDDNVLAASFKTDVATIQKLKDGLAPKA